MGPQWWCSLFLLGIRLVAYGHLARLSLLSSSSIIYPPTERTSSSPHRAFISCEVLRCLQQRSTYVNASLGSTSDDDRRRYQHRRPERANRPATPTPLRNDEGNLCRDSTLGDHWSGVSPTTPPMRKQVTTTLWGSFATENAFRALDSPFPGFTENNDTAPGSAPSTARTFVRHKYGVDTALSGCALGFHDPSRAYPVRDRQLTAT